MYPNKTLDLITYVSWIMLDLIITDSNTKENDGNGR